MSLKKKALWGDGADFVLVAHHRERVFFLADGYCESTDSNIPISWIDLWIGNIRIGIFLNRPVFNAKLG